MRQNFAAAWPAAKALSRRPASTPAETDHQGNLGEDRLEVALLRPFRRDRIGRARIRAVLFAGSPALPFLSATSCPVCEETTEILAFAKLESLEKYLELEEELARPDMFNDQNQPPQGADHRLIRICAPIVGAFRAMAR